MTGEDPYQTLVEVIRTRAAAPSRGAGAFLVGVSGGVAVGKSTLAKELAERLVAGAPQLQTEVVATDGFLRPNAELASQDLSRRKGFPESYDNPAFHAFLEALAAGREAATPVYSHVSYDIVPDQTRVVADADVVIVEGINALQTSEARARFGLSIYIDADPEHMRAWYLRRLDEIVANEPHSLIAQVRDPEQRRAIVDQVWRETNLVNLRDHIAPTAALADVVVRKGADHAVVGVRLR